MMKAFFFCVFCHNCRIPIDCNFFDSLPKLPQSHGMPPGCTSRTTSGTRATVFEPLSQTQEVEGGTECVIWSVCKWDPPITDDAMNETRAASTTLSCGIAEWRIHSQSFLHSAIHSKHLSNNLQPHYQQHRLKGWLTLLVRKPTQHFRDQCTVLKVYDWLFWLEVVHSAQVTNFTPLIVLWQQGGFHWGLGEIQCLA